MLLNYSCFMYEHAEKIMEALEKDGSHFAKETVETILKRSPTSVKITLEHIRQGSKLSLKECLKMEHRLWQTVPVSDFIIMLCVCDLLILKVCT